MNIFICFSLHLVCGLDKNCANARKARETGSKDENLFCKTG
jgi:hypothetical protein